MRKIDFRTISNKQDLFAHILKSDVLDFGFIPKWDRKKFLKFLKENKLIVPFSEGCPEWSWKAKHKFTYTVTRPEFGGLPGRSLAEWYIDIRKKYTGYNHKEYHHHLRRFHVTPKKRKGDRDFTIINRDLIYT